MTSTITGIDPERLRRLRELMREAGGVKPWMPHPHQIEPDLDWFLWLMEMGRGSGKTATASHHVQRHLDGPACISGDLPHRVALIAPTLGDAIESAALTDMALVRLNPGAKFTQSGGGSMVRWPGGSQVRLFGTHTREDVNRLRAGGNRCFVWAEELASWRYLEEAWDHMMFGLRLGPNPQVIATTTPKARPDYIKVRDTADHISGATTMDNPNLNEAQKQRLLDRYGDTTIGQQEIYGLLIEEAEGAIWSIDIIEAGRQETLLEYPDLDDDETPPNPIGRIVVAVDPPGGATEAGIVVAGTVPRDCPCKTDAPYPHYAVLEDRSGKLSPTGWATRAIEGYHVWEGDRVVGETNYGGDMVQSVIKTVDSEVPYKPVHASRGKQIRAEPIFGLYEQGRVHHVGRFAALEAEMVQWIPNESDWSPNRLDALVWAITELSSRNEWKFG